MVTTTRYLYFGNQYVGETDENGTLQRRYVNEPDTYTHLIAQHGVSSGENRYYHYDAIGSTRQVTDDTETVTDEFTYDAWGNRLSRTGTSDIPFQYVGEHGYLLDEVTSHYYVLERTFVPDFVRWLSADPIVAHFAYSYSNNNPMNLVDPSGLIPASSNWYCTWNSNFIKFGECIAECTAVCGSCFACLYYGGGIQNPVCQAICGECQRRGGLEQYIDCYKKYVKYVCFNVTMELRECTRQGNTVQQAFAKKFTKAGATHCELGGGGQLYFYVRYKCNDGSTFIKCEEDRTKEDFPKKIRKRNKQEYKQISCDNAGGTARHFKGACPQEIFPLDFDPKYPVDPRKDPPFLVPGF